MVAAFAPVLAAKPSSAGTTTLQTNERVRVVIQPPRRETAAVKATPRAGGRQSVWSAPTREFPHVSPTMIAKAILLRRDVEIYARVEREARAGCRHLSLTR